MKKLLLAAVVAMCGAMPAMADTEIVPTPAAGTVESFGPSIDFSYVKDGQQYPDPAGWLFVTGVPSAVTVTNENGEEVAGLNPAYESVNDGEAMKIKISREVTEPGTYTFTVGGGIICIAGRNNTVTFGQTSFTYVISGETGVSGIEAQQAPAAYYDLQGRSVANPWGGVYVRVCGGKATKVAL